MSKTCNGGSCKWYGCRLLILLIDCMSHCMSHCMDLANGMVVDYGESEQEACKEA